MRKGRTALRSRALAGAAVLAALGAPALALAHATLAQKGTLRVASEGKLSPSSLPRKGAAPVAVSLGAKISTTDGSNPPQLRTISIAINREGRIDRTGLPVCDIHRIQPSTNQEALAACRRSLIGEGRFSAKILLPESSPFPSEGKVYAFNGEIGCSPAERQLRALLGSGAQGSHLPTGRLWPSRSRTQGGWQGERTPVRDPRAADRGRRDAQCHSRPAILAHVYGTNPLPTSYTLPFAIKATRGTFGTTLTTSLPQTTGEWGFVTGIQMTLKRKFSYRGQSHSYISAGCPAPKGFSQVPFSLAKASYGFAGQETLTSTVTRTCRAR